MSRQLDPEQLPKAMKDAMARYESENELPQGTIAEELKAWFNEHYGDAAAGQRNDK